MKKAVKIVAFLLVLALCYAAVDQVLMIKTDDMTSMTKLRALPEDTVDVLMVGSSHVGMNIDNQRIFDETGIASYDLWVGMQPLWSSYYYLTEALKHQSPKVVMVDVFLCGTTADYSSQEVALKNIEMLPLGLNKLKAAFAAFETWQDSLEAFWGMPYYHTRYDELTQADFVTNRDDLSLAVPSQTEGVVNALNILDYDAITDTLPLTEKNQKYLKKLMALCRQKNIELVLIVSPYEATEEECMRLNSVEKLAAENGVTMLNFLKNWDTKVIDPLTDFYDIGHLNNQGIARFSTLLGQWLKENYDLRDCRQVADHVWNTSDRGHQTASAQEPLFLLTEAFRGDGIATCVDTGVKLFGNRYGSWTLLARVDTNLLADGDQVLLSCFNEENSGNYRGLLLRGNQGSLQLILGNNVAVQLPSDLGDEMTLAIAKDAAEYTVYVNGTLLFSDREYDCDAYNGTLLIGCQELAPGGEKFRYSATHVLNLEVYDSVLSSTEILSWQPEDLPEAELPLGIGVTEATQTYTLPEQFIGGVEGYRQAEWLDTGVQLFESPVTRFTLLTSVTPTENPGSGVFLSCFDENQADYRGLLIRQLDNAQVNIVFGGNSGVTVQGTMNEPMQLAIIKDGSQYRIYADGDLVAETTSPANAYDGTLLLGAQRDAEGNVFRISQTQVQHLTVFAGVLDEAALAEWTYPAADMPKPLVAESVAYTLSGAFVGNGTDRVLDTGVKLFDVSTKDWTLDTVLDVRKGVNNGVYMSCFSEEAGHYRGFMIRQDGTETISVYVGNSYAFTLDLPANQATLHLVLVKQDAQYSLYADGALVGQVESACDNYDETLLLGAQRDADGNLFRFSGAGVRTLTTLDQVLSAEEAEALSAEALPGSRF